ncbi:DinB family protein [Thalassoglobus sp. JC818]|uniref:DinB family protein n=1 Tax=Thalassoglobus sp. JC818 TaxID=3232136 RepID=UPI003459CC08
MSRSIGTTISDSLQMSMSYAERLLKDVPADRFARFASVGGVAVESNHPAFILGHLSLYPTLIVQQLGGDASKLTPSEKSQQVFSKTATCQDDPDGTIYPAMEEVVQSFFRGYEAAMLELKKTPDAEFQRPNPGEGRIVELFPTLSSMHAFYCGGHIMMHLGQFSAWRRMEGMGAA